jgi:predicted phosphodiesterase
VNHIMRLLVFADIHGNAVALEAILADSLRHGPYDGVICGGDLVWAGPKPRPVLDRMRQLCRNDPTGESGGAVCLQGNCDLFLLDGYGQEIPAGKKRERFLTHRAWMLDQLADNDLIFLQNMPLSYCVSPAPGHDLLVVHANPHNVDDPIYPEMSDDEIEAVVGDAQFEVLAYGHIHLPSVRLWRGRLLANVSSVGLPRDGDTRAAYSVLTWSGGWRVAQYRVEYDVDQVASDMRTSGLPRGRHFARRLLQARYQ